MLAECGSRRRVGVLTSLARLTVAAIRAVPALFYPPNSPRASRNTSEIDGIKK